MSKRRRTSGCSYIPLVVIALALLLWVTGVLQINLSPQINVPPDVQTQIAGIQTPIAQLPGAVASLIPNLTPTPGNGPAAAPPVLGQRTKTSGCLANQPLPDSACTPGAVFPQATQAQICVPGYSGSVRDVPDAVKNQVYAEYGITQHAPGQYEVDHLVSLELGGSNDIANLWPEPADPRPGFHEKDRVENYLHDQVCKGAMSLQQAQTEIASNWLAAYNSMPK